MEVDYAERPLWVRTGGAEYRQKVESAIRAVFTGKSSGNQDSARLELGWVRQRRTPRQSQPCKIAVELELYELADLEFSGHSIRIYIDVLPQVSAVLNVNDMKLFDENAVFLRRPNTLIIARDVVELYLAADFNGFSLDFYVTYTSLPKQVVPICSFSDSATSDQKLYAVSET